MAGFGLGIGILGGLAIAAALILIFSNVAYGAPGVSVAFMMSGRRKSLELKEHGLRLADEARAILDRNNNRPLSADDERRFKELTTQMRETADNALRYETLEAEAAGVPTLYGPSRIPGQGLAADFSDNISIPRNATPKLLKNYPAKDVYSSGMWLLAAVFNKPKAIAWCRDHGVPLIQDATSEGSNTSGGYLVPTVLENMIIDLREQYGVFRQEAKIVPMASDAVNIPRRSGGLTAYPIGESSAPTESTKTWNQVNLVARKWGVLTRYTNEVAEDAVINVAEDLAGEIAYAFSLKEDDCGFNGDGSGSYHGIQGVVTRFQNNLTWVGSVAAASGHGTFALLDNTDLTKLIASIPKYAVANAKWYISQAGFAGCFQRLAATAGGNTITTLGGALGFQYLGYPVVLTQTMTVSLGSLTNKAMILFGDMRSAVAMGTRRGVTIAISPDIYFTTDEVAMRGTERFDIVAHDLGDASAAGPLVAMIGG
jgi:HK97 family phage major capsid protein